MSELLYFFSLLNRVLRFYPGYRKTPDFERHFPEPENREIVASDDLPRCEKSTH
jgi:hypothetical protein